MDIGVSPGWLWTQRREGATPLASIPRLRGLQELVALLPVARAELVRLQRVQRPQHFVDVAADAQVVHRREADDPLGIHDERRTERHAFLLVEDAERRRQLALDV